LVALSSVFARNLGGLRRRGVARSSQRPISFQFWSKKTTTGID